MANDASWFSKTGSLNPNLEFWKTRTVSKTTDRWLVPERFENRTGKYYRYRSPDGQGDNTGQLGYISCQINTVGFGKTETLNDRRKLWKTRTVSKKPNRWLVPVPCQNRTGKYCRYYFSYAPDENTRGLAQTTWQNILVSLVTTGVLDVTN